MLIKDIDIWLQLTVFIFMKIFKEIEMSKKLGVTISTLAATRTRAQTYANAMGFSYLVYEVINPMDERYIGHHVLISSRNDTYKGGKQYSFVETVEPE